MASEPVRVGLDVTPAATAKTGLRRYAEELWQALSARDDVDVSAFALGRGEMPASGLPVRRVALPLRVLRPSWRLLGRPTAELFAGDVDLVHSIALRPAPTRKPRIQTIHDVLPITHPHLYPEVTKRVYRQELAEAAAADLVLTTCETTAGEIARVGGIPRGRIAVASPGAYLSGADSNLPPVASPYVLAVGLVTPRKGLEVLARAAAKLGSGCPPVLVVGPDWWRAKEVRAEIERLDTARVVTLLGSVEDALLAALYRGATTVCHTSRAEGFGMTCLEAMAAGSPLVASDIPSVRELTAGAAVLVPIDDADALSDALAALLADEDRRRELADAGRARSRHFSWENMADEVVGAYHRALAG